MDAVLQDCSVEFTVNYSFIVLTLDDDPTMQALYTIAFRNLPVRLLMAESEAQARRFIENESPDLFLVDFWLGEENGLEIAEKLLETMQRDIPMVVVTAETGDLVGNRLNSSRCLGYLLKPISLATFGAEALNYLGIESGPEQVAAHKAASDGRGGLPFKFLQNALAKTRAFSLRSDSDLFQDTGLAQAAHQWVGASGIDCVPKVEEEARALEKLARTERSEDLSNIRHLLSVIEDKFEGAAASLSSEQS